MQHAICNCMQISTFILRFVLSVGRVILPRTNQPGVNMYSLVRRTRHSSGSSNDDLYVLQATTYHHPNMDSAVQDLFLDERRMGAPHGDQMTRAISPGSNMPGAPPNTAESPLYRVELRDTILSFLENAILTSEIPNLSYSADESSQNISEDNQGPLEPPIIPPIHDSVLLVSQEPLSPRDESEGMIAINPAAIQRDGSRRRSNSNPTLSRQQYPGVTTRSRAKAKEYEDMLINQNSLANPTSPTLNEMAASPTKPEKEDWPDSGETEMDDITNLGAAGQTHWVESQSLGQKSSTNTNKRRRMDLTASLEIPSSTLNPNASAFTPSGDRQESANTSPAHQGARPKTSRPLTRRPKRGRIE